MARATKKVAEEVKIEEVVEALDIENVEPETVDIAEVKPEPILKIIIAKTPTPFRKIANLETKYIVGQMPVGTAYTIEKEVKSKIYGDFYLLNNGCYITKSGNYLVK